MNDRTQSIGSDIVMTDLHNQLAAAQAEIARLKEALDVAVEGLEKIETSSGLSVRAENQPKFIAKVALDKIKQIREKK